MNKNGFIATSLIYSFFLIFITLFLTIIADFLQNKVLLSTIEKGIKDELNSTMSIEDFEVGDTVFFDNSMSGKYNDVNGEQWIVAYTKYDIDNPTNSTLILYSYKTTEDSDITDKLTLNDITNDLNYGYFNNTYLQKMLSSFHGEYFDLIEKVGQEGTTYNYYEIQLESTNCISIENNGISNTCFNSTPIDGDYILRLRKELQIGTDRLTINKDSEDSSIINITGVAS